MRIVELPQGGTGPVPAGWDLDAEFLEALPVVGDYRRLVAGLRGQCAVLREIGIEELLTFFDGLAASWLSSRVDLLRSLAPLNPGFALPFMRRANLARLLGAALRGNPRFLDGFEELPGLGRRVMAHPRGVVTHWLAGNVPVLGLLSIVQAAVSKNVSVVKVPRESGRMLPWVWGWVAEAATGDGRQAVVADAVARSVRFVYCGSEDREAHEVLSLASDVRVAWGGADVVQAIASLPRGHDTQDVVFGPKRSLAVIGRHALDRGNVARYADAVAFDASVDDQRGCHSPHVVFVEEGGLVDAGAFARELAGAMDRMTARLPKPSATPAEAYRVASVRAEWSLDGTVHASAGTAWTVVCAAAAGLDDACGGRVVFVRPIGDVMDVPPLLGSQHQAIGLLIDELREAGFARAAAARGVARITRPGQMARFDYPWDGVFPIDRLVRWVSLD